MAKSRGRRKIKQKRPTTKAQTASPLTPRPQATPRRFVMLIRSIFYPYWKLSVEAIAVAGAAVGIYVAFLSAEPEIHLTDQSSDAPVEYAFYIRENSPVIATHIFEINCIIEEAHDIKQNIMREAVMANSTDKLIGTGNRQVYYRCPVHLGIPIISIRTSVIIAFRWHIFGFDLWSSNAKSLAFTWPAGPHDKHWREGATVN